MYLTIHQSKKKLIGSENKSLYLILIKQLKAYVTFVFNTFEHKHFSNYKAKILYLVWIIKIGYILKRQQILSQII